MIIRAAVTCSNTYQLKHGLKINSGYYIVIKKLLFWSIFKLDQNWQNGEHSFWVAVIYINVKILLKIVFDI